MVEFLNLGGLDATSLSGLFVVAVLAGFIDSIAGGRVADSSRSVYDRITPQEVFATSKLGACFGSFSASMTFIRRREVAVRPMIPVIAITFVGAIIGSFALLILDTGFLRGILPFLLIAIALYMLLIRNVGAFETRRRLNDRAFNLIFGLGLGFYDGFFGPGTGSFWALAYVTMAGQTLRRATGHAKLVNFTSNIASVLLLTGGGHMLWGLGFILAAGQFIGARLGAKLVLAKGAKLVRPMLVILSLAITFRLLHQEPHHPLSRLALTVWRAIFGS